MNSEEQQISELVLSYYDDILLLLVLYALYRFMNRPHLQSIISDAA